MDIIFKRFAELLFPEILLSMLISFLHVNTSLNNGMMWISVASVILFILYLMYNVFLLNACYEEVYQTFEYFVCNIIANILFLAVCIVGFIFLNKDAYVWFFSFSDLFGSFFDKISEIGSILIFNGILFLVTFFVPVIKGEYM
ncbi:MAG: hypothetical protein IKU47_00150 [Oscillospiraceae bacterium]|nr:hypothetical protein [Oscillospiraceae bacterium]